MVVLIMTNFLQARLGSLQRRWRHQKQLHSTSRKLQVTHKWIKPIWSDTSKQTFHQANTTERFSSQDQPVTSDIQVSNSKCHHTRGSLILNKLIQANIGVLSVMISEMMKDLSVQPRRTSASPVTNMDISQAWVLRNKYLLNQKHPKHTNYKLKKCICKMIPYTAIQKNLPPVKSPFVYKWKSNVHKLSPRFPQHLIL